MTDKTHINTTFNAQRAYFNTHATHGFSFRQAQLTKLKQALITYADDLTTALQQDLGKPAFESYASEIGFILKDISHTLKHLKKWMKPQSVTPALITLPTLRGSSKIHQTPRGVNLIIAPFNYPIGLTFSPLIAAIAAGNTAMIKTSELTPHCNQVISQLIAKTFDPEYVAYIAGAIPETTALLALPFDHILFTGSPRVGRIVMQAAASHLTPVTLELGGKSPCIVHHDANLKLAAKRIVMGKFTNAGQTCIAPDYLLVHERILKPFQQEIKTRIQEIYGANPQTCKDYGRIINQHHVDRLAALIHPDKVLVGGQVDKDDCYISPTVMTDISLADPIMSDEIFGPLLPILSYKDPSDIFAITEQLPAHPLSCYLFTHDKKLQQHITTTLPFGGGCINHCLLHAANLNLPFGGMRNSGIGSYHGQTGFRAFSHQKSMLKSTTRIDPDLPYPPFNKKRKTWIMRFLLK